VYLLLRQYIHVSLRDILINFFYIDLICEVQIVRMKKKKFREFFKTVTRCFGRLTLQFSSIDIHNLEIPFMQICE
jgi:hypothetical protein